MEGLDFEELVRRQKAFLGDAANAPKKPGRGIQGL